MPFFANTPESRIDRSDSKNPSTTCRGITSSGRPCRRPIAASNVPPPTSARRPANLRVDDPSDENLYCWQHKEQASLSARSSPGPKTTTTPILEERTSLDTLADRLGLISTQTEKPPKRHGRTNTNAGNQKQRSSKVSHPKPQGQLMFCCCFKIPIEEVSPPPRPKPQPLQPSVSTPPPRFGGKMPTSQYPPSSSRPLPGQSGKSSSRRRSSNASQTAEYMSLIPMSTPAVTASLLLAELAKPISAQDEPGYIYIFWLTPESKPSTPAAEAARTLLSPATPTRPSKGRRPSDVLIDFASMTDDTDTRGLRTSGGGKKKILLKIGRANNVHRRLNEWQRQCGYNLSLIRYYPYIPSASPVPVPRKIPHSHRVERLVHLELAGLGFRVADREKCATCGREHREWFEVEPTRRAVAEVDDVVRRWSDWNETQA